LHAAHIGVHANARHSLQQRRRRVPRALPLNIYKDRLMTDTPTGPWPGRFVWFDMMTTDAAKSKAFYTALFNWKVEDVPMGAFTYGKLIAGPGPIGGIVEEKAIPRSHWMPYVAVDDVDASAVKCQELGGTVCIEPCDIPGTGRFAVVGDPQGGFFSIYKGDPQSPGADPDEPVIGRVCWNEILTTDDAKAQEFYSGMFGWTAESKDMGPMGMYHCQMLDGKQVSGIMKNPMNGAPTCWLSYFLVEDLAASTIKAKELGANAMMENTPIPGVGSFSMLADPCGAVFALFEGANDPDKCD
jgi:predicted enzyme related to lactoylglutathione lyase